MIYLNINYPNLIRMLVKWVPIGLFLLVLVVGVLLGYSRGARKSLKLFLRAVIIMLTLLIVFEIVVENEAFDKFLLNAVNLFMGKDGLEQRLGVPTSCETLREVILAFLPQRLNYIDGLALILEENGRYLLTMVNAVYRSILSIVFLVLFVLIDFIWYILGAIFNSERKYRKKQERAFLNGEEDERYHKNRFRGALIGGLRSTLVGVLSLSMLGSIFFIVAGGKGDEKLPDYDFGDEKVNLFYDCYKAVAEYGTDGIFKILNKIDDPRKVPYYLYATDLVFQGGFEEPESGHVTQIMFREELASYVDFSRNTFELMMKYGKDDILPIILKQKEGNLMNEVMKVMSKEEFQVEFESLIEGFDTNTYFINFSLSLVNTIVANLDEIEFTKNMNPEILDLMSIMFKKGYLSPNIPYEKVLIDLGEKPELGYIKATDLVSKSDILLVYKIFNNFLKEAENLQESSKSDQILMLTKVVLDDIQGLTICSESNASKFNPVFKRLYAYLENKYLTDTEPEVVPAKNSMRKKDMIYIDEAYDSINWLHEINTLIDLISDGLSVYENSFKDKVTEGSDYFKILLNIFDPENGQKDEALAIDIMIERLAQSEILNQVLSSKKIYSTIEKSVTGFVKSEEFKLPDDINFSNVYDKNGNLVKTGEVYNLFKAVRFFLSNKDAQKLLDSFNDTTLDKVDLIREVIKVAISKDVTTGASFADYLINSRVLQSVLSEFVIVNKDLSETISIYIDDSLLEVDKNGNLTRIIVKSEISKFIYKALDLFDLVTPFMDPENKPTTEDIIGLLKNDALVRVLDSKIIEGTISNITKGMLGDNEFLVIPEQMVLVSNDEEASEIKKLITALKTSEIDLGVLLGNAENKTALIMEEIKKLDDDKASALAQSTIFNYTISNFLFTNNILGDDFELVIPNASSVSLTGEKIQRCLTEEALTRILRDMVILLPEDNASLGVNNLLQTIAVNKERLAKNDIIMASFTNILVSLQAGDGTTEGDGSFIKIPESYKSAGSKENLEKSYGNDNIWKAENARLIDALDEIFELSNPDTVIDLNDTEAVKAKIFGLVETINDESSVDNNRTKLDVCYDSKVVACTISDTLSSSLTEIIAPEKLNAIKDRDNIVFKHEIKSLVDTTKILGLDFNDKETNLSDQAFNKIKKDFLKLNDPKPDGSETDLHIICSSSLINYVLTDTINKILIDDKNDKNSLVDKNSIKISLDEYDNYKEMELSSLIDLIEILVSGETPEETQQNLDDLLTNHTFDISASVSEKLEQVKANLPKLYNESSREKTYLVGLLLTKQISGSAGLEIPESAYYYRTKCITCTEVLALLDAVDALGLTFDRITTDDIKGMLTNIREPMDPYNPNSQSKLDVIYSSLICAGKVSSMIDDILTEDLIDQRVKKSKKLKPDDIYTLEEINALFDAIESNEGFQIKLTELFDLKPDTLITRLQSRILAADLSVDLLWNSKLISFIFTNQIENILCTKQQLISEAARREPAIRENFDTSLSYLKSSEISNLLRIIREDFEVEDINAIDPSKFLKFDDTTIDSIYTSNIIKFIIENQISKVLKDYLDSKVIASTRDKVGNTPIIKKSEIKNLVYSIKIFGIEDLDNFDNFDLQVINDLNKPILNDHLHRTRLDVIYEGTLVKYLMSYQISDVLCPRENSKFDAFIESSVLNHQLVKENDEFVGSKRYNNKNSYIKQSEVIALIEAQKVLGIDLSNTGSLGNADLLSKLNEDLDKNLDIINKSYIIRGVMTKTIHDEIAKNKNYLAESKKAYEGDINLYKKSEIKEIMKVAGTSINNIDLSSINLYKTSPSSEEGIYLEDYLKTDANGNVPSYLLLASISRSLISLKQLVIPIETYNANYDYIEPTAILDLIKACKTLNLPNNIKSIDFSALELPNSDETDIVAKSSIFRGSIINNLKFSGNLEKLVLFNKEYYEKTRDVANGSREASIISEKECKALFNSLALILGSNVSLNNIQIDVNVITGLCKRGEGDLRKILSSSMIHILVSGFIEQIPNSNMILGLLGIKKTKASVYNLSTSKDSSKQIYSVDSIIEFMGYLSKFN